MEDTFYPNNHKDTTSSSSKSEEKKDYFGNGLLTQDGHFHFLSQKSQRLSTALYMLTNLFEQGDPLRFRLRELALRFVSDTMSLVSLTVKERDDKIKSIYFVSSEVLSFCEIGYASGMISEMNHTILKKEFKIFMDTLQSKRVRKDEENTFTIPSNFFEVNPVLEKKDAGVSDVHNFEKEVIKTLALSHSSNGQKINKGQYGDKGHIATNKDTVLYKVSAPESNLIDRKDMILRTFRDSKKEQLSIKDITEIIKDCSEKTIQRQLIDMVKTGVLEKQGERRWSTYSLKK